MTSDGKTPNEARWEELVEAEACGGFDDAERSELERLTEGNEERRWELRMLATIPTLTATQSELRPEDQAMIDRVLDQHGQEGRRRTLTIGWAAALFIPLSAAAAYLIREDSQHQVPSTFSSDQPAVVPVPTISATERQTPRVAVKKEPAAKATEPFTTRPPPHSASELLNRAQKARAARDYQKAAQTYLQLLRLYPASGEARVARLSLAQLHLAEGNAAAALARFDEYHRSGGELSQEAHYGKIEALRALGRTAEEHAEINRFVTRYPKSLHAAALKRRLGVIGGPE